MSFQLQQLVYAVIHTRTSAHTHTLTPTIYGVFTYTRQSRRWRCGRVYRRRLHRTSKRRPSKFVGWFKPKRYRVLAVGCTDFTLATVSRTSSPHHKSGAVFVHGILLCVFFFFFWFRCYIAVWRTAVTSAIWYVGSGWLCLLPVVGT